MAEWTISVSELNEYVRRQLAQDPMLRSLNVAGELSGFKRHSSGHLYFQLKDEAARISCVMFRQHAMSLSFAPRDGQRVILTGSAALFARDGQYQFYCERMRSEGVGALFVRFEQLKARLLAEGLFDASLKKPLPLFPRVVGVVTSPTGAVLRDIAHVAARRNAGVRLLLCPARVQGDGAAQEIARAIDMLNEHGVADVILCGRGGGSIEELWAFNEEVVVRAIAASRIPVVSCVGHETDTTLADLVADLRAPTPSAAAEVAIPSREALLLRLRVAARRLTAAQRALLLGYERRLARCARSQVLARGERLLLPQQRRVQAAARLLTAHARAALRDAELKLAKPRAMLDALSPLAVLTRGYAIVYRDGELIPEAARLASGDDIVLRMHGGTRGARITDTGDDDGKEK